MINNLTVIGIGRLGLCTALCLESVGYNVMGIDVSQKYIDSLNNKTFNSPEPLVNEYLKKSTKFTASTSLQEGLKYSNVIFIFVPTPTSPGLKSYDHSILSSLLSQINVHHIQNKHIVIGCTVLPGYIKTIGKFLLRDCANVTLSYNPEFIAQGAIISGIFNSDMVLIGEENKDIGDILQNIHQKLSSSTKIQRMSPESAEIAKLSVNCFVTTKIAFANMIADIADKTSGANSMDILNAIGFDSRIGKKCLKPGYGFGGPCFPRDNRALGNYSKSLGLEPVIPQATDIANINHTNFQIENLEKNCDIKIPLIFENVTYKENCSVPIIEESQKLVIAKALALKGYQIVIYDNPEIVEEVRKEYGNIFSYKTKI